MLRIFATHGVVPDKLQTQTVELGNQVRRYVDDMLLQLPGFVLGQRQACRHFIVDDDVDLRQLFQQCRRVGVLQVQLGTRHNRVGPHIETDTVARFHTPQVHRIIAAQLFEGHGVIIATGCSNGWSALGAGSAAVQSQQGTRNACQGTTRIAQIGED